MPPSQKTDWRLWMARVRRAIDDKGITPKEIAARMVAAGYRNNLEAGTVRSWLNGNRQINLEDFFRICELVGVSPMASLFGDEYENDFLDLAEIWRKADDSGRKTIQLAIRIAREHARDRGIIGGGLPSE